MTVLILESAEHDLKDLRSSIVKNFSSENWRDTYAKLKASIRNLQDFVLAGSIPDEIENCILANTGRWYPNGIVSSTKCGKTPSLSK